MAGAEAQVNPSDRPSPNSKLQGSSSGLSGLEPVPLSSVRSGSITGASNPRNRRNATAYSNPGCRSRTHMPPLLSLNQPASEDTHTPYPYRGYPLPCALTPRAFKADSCPPPLRPRLAPGSVSVKFRCTALRRRAAEISMSAANSLSILAPARATALPPR